MRIPTAEILLVFSGLCLGFRIEDFIENNYEYQHQLPEDFANERQDVQSPDVLIPAFITTFIASSITNLLFPRVSLLVQPPSTPSPSPNTSPPPTPSPPSPPRAGQEILSNWTFSQIVLFPKICILACTCGIEKRNRITSGKPVDPVRFDIDILFLHLFIFKI